jgi:hypothetical protein
VRHCCMSHLAKLKTYDDTRSVLVTVKLRVYCCHRSKLEDINDLLWIITFHTPNIRQLQPLSFSRAPKKVKIISAIVQMTKIQKSETTTKWDRSWPVGSLMFFHWTREELNTVATSVAGRYNVAIIVNACSFAESFRPCLAISVSVEFSRSVFDAERSIRDIFACII